MPSGGDNSPEYGDSPEADLAQANCGAPAVTGEAGAAKRPELRLQGSGGGFSDNWRINHAQVAPAASYIDTGSSRLGWPQDDGKISRPHAAGSSRRAPRNYSIYLVLLPRVAAQSTIYVTSTGTETFT